MDQQKKSNQFYMGFDKELNELSVQGIAKLERYLETHKPISVVVVLNTESV